MRADQCRLWTGRVGGTAAAIGVGAIIACSTASPCAAEDGTSGASTASSARVDTTPADRAPSADHGARDDEQAPDDADTGTDAGTDDSGTDTDTDVVDAGFEGVDDTALEPSPDPSDEGEAADDDESSVAPSPVLRTIDDTRVGQDGDAAAKDTHPDEPSASAALWALTGSARRADDGDEEPAPAPAAAGQLHEPEPPGPTPDTTTQDPLPPESPYTGRPSFIHHVVTFGLTVLKAVLKPFGGLLAFTSLKIPFLTDGVPPFFLTGGLKVERSEFEGMKVWTLTPRREAGDKVVVALHGGAYVATASIFHWWTYADMARDTGATVVVPLQTLVPKGGTAATEVPRTADFISKVIDDHGAENVSLLGDSAGGGLALAAVQELVRRGSRNPARLVLLAPWLDVSMSDPRSAEIDDPLLDIPNLTRSGARWAGGAEHAAHPLASPLFGSPAGLPPTFVYSSSRDLLTVDTLRLRERVFAAGVPDVTFRLREGLIHDWATFPFLPDAHEDRPSIYADLLGSVATRVVV